MTIELLLQIAAGMGDAVTEAELAALLANLSAGPTVAGAKSSPAANQEVDFHGFVRLFRGVF